MSSILFVHFFSHSSYFFLWLPFLMVRLSDFFYQCFFSHSLFVLFKSEWKRSRECFWNMRQLKLGFFVFCQYNNGIELEWRLFFQIPYRHFHCILFCYYHIHNTLRTLAIDGLLNFKAAFIPNESNNNNGKSIKRFSAIFSILSAIMGAEPKIMREERKKFKYRPDYK